MLKLLDKMYIGMKNRVNNFLTNEDGAVDIVAIVVLCGIVIAVAVIFRDELQKVVESLFQTVKDKGNRTIGS
ncbi:Flp1 family type IVb pilin [Bovifimicola ammoniilytica]|jgi:undecaprenyl pyrophosphate phosphatase UppP|uniref:Flp1 family type IVb pilin n=1 Tax=Bovifimicola ammoniilytica TaxID=2981720 RepID=UPI00033DCF49|nr:Flp1 family type IVb pilin [Bovifimicola ammoniilytica]MCU6754056.1 Flp1 family type IVb pilin [Bovifimicola ammoniilytica]CCZ03752.1 putative uncharacterized protein [Eubacterium sp. CAG:603]SCJ79554.1 Uncharacterised protein [uncultured Eubacterium sp.]